MVCVNGNYNEGTCTGDMGTPLLQHVGRGYYLIVGVASFISGNGCESTDPSGYTRTFSYMDWIKNVTNREEPSTESRGRNRTPGNVVLGRVRHPETVRRVQVQKPPVQDVTRK
jgi:secreted trypsin-like serine protease